MDIIDFLFFKSNFIIIFVVGAFIIKMLISIETDLVKISSEISETNLQLNKLLNTLMSSLNDVRKLVNQKNRTNHNDHL
jgi:hypothetical protein